MEVNTQKLNKFISAIDWDKVWRENFNSSDSLSYFYKGELVHTDEDYEETTGATKLVIIDDNSYVVKVPLRYVYDDCLYDAENDEYYDDYTPLDGAPNPIDDDDYSTWDYCHSEIQYYQLAKDAGIGCLFAETVKYCDEPYPVYLQEKCINFWKRKSPPRSEKERKERTKELSKSASYEQKDWILNFQDEWILDVVDLYGEQILFNLFNFLDQYNINDLHSSNYGYSTIDGRPVLIDFSGFHD